MSAQTDPSRTDPSLAELAKTDPAISEHEPHAEVHFEPHHHYRDDDFAATPDGVMECSNVDVYYGVDFRAVTGVDLSFSLTDPTALIGPSGLRQVDAAAIS